jgi:hypothetical protein
VTVEFVQNHVLLFVELHRDDRTEIRGGLNVGREESDGITKAILPIEGVGDRGDQVVSLSPVGAQCPTRR